MKLLDLLKSLNNGPALNPDNVSALNPAVDATAPIHSPMAATTDNRKRLLTELTFIAELLDAPTATPEPATISTATSAVTPAAGNLLDIEHIFGESDGLEASDDLILADTHATPLLFMPAENTADIHDNRKQIIESLLDELLPIFEEALAQRLNQLDNTTLQQWHQTLLETADLHSPASK